MKRHEDEQVQRRPSARDAFAQPHLAPLAPAPPSVMGQNAQMPEHGGFPGYPVPPGFAMPPQQQASGPSSFRQLNVRDALSYLDQVKLQFAEQPEVYNQFLEIMKDFKSQAIDTPGVIQRVSTLFKGHTNLIMGFNTFLPPGFKIEIHDDVPVAMQGGIPVQMTAQSGPPTPLGPQPHHPSPMHPAQMWSFSNEPSPNAGGPMSNSYMTASVGQSMLLPQLAPPQAPHMPFAQSQPPSQQSLASSSQLPGLGMPMQTAVAPNLSVKQPLEFNHAINFVNKIKVCLAFDFPSDHTSLTLSR